MPALTAAEAQALSEEGERARRALRRRVLALTEIQAACCEWLHRRGHRPVDLNKVVFVVDNGPLARNPIGVKLEVEEVEPEPGGLRYDMRG